VDDRRAALAQRIAELRQEFLAGSALAAERCAALADEYRTSSAPTLLQEIEMLSHRLVGAGGSFGLTRISAAAAAIEGLVSSRRREPPDPATVLAGLPAALAELRAALREESGG
jgi:HPt (histidine-containing phosphotransfer) domain-containing protein